jgi:hypothetical protein
MTTEAALERRCCALVKAAGGWPVKLWPTVAGLPDRLMLLPGGTAWFVEFKAPGGRVRPAQRRVFDVLARLDFYVDVIRSVEAFELTLQATLDNIPRPGP